VEKWESLSHDFLQLRDAIMAWDLKVRAVDTELAKAEDALLRVKQEVAAEGMRNGWQPLDLQLAEAAGYWDGLRVASELLHR
jgi:hypothetical protein